MKKKLIVITSAILFFIALLNPQSSMGFYGDSVFSKKFYIYQSSSGCYYPDCIDDNSDITIRGEIFNKIQNEPATDGKIRVFIDNNKISEFDFVNGQIGPILINSSSIPAGKHSLRVMWKVKGILYYEKLYEMNFTTVDECSSVEIASCSGEHNINEINWDLCSQASEANDILRCHRCLAKDGIWTALGCIPTEPTGLIQTLIKIGLMVGGGVATLIILAGGFMLSISQGDPKKTSEAKEMISAAIIGLIFIVFSISILQLIGVQILQIPGFGAE